MAEYVILGAIGIVAIVAIIAIVFKTPFRAQLPGMDLTTGHGKVPPEEPS